MKHYSGWDGQISQEIRLGRERLLVMAGPCMLESLELGLEVGTFLRDTCRELGINYVFKGSFDKANRTSARGVRGPQLEKGLLWLRTIRDLLGVPVVTDVHLPEQVGAVAEVCEILQIPAFLCKQRALLDAVAATGRTVHIKKAQHASPHEMNLLADGLRANGNAKLLLCERGTSFGYNDLIVDFRGLMEMRTAGNAVVFDATHSVMLPGAGGGRSGGLRQFVSGLARAAVAVGVDGIFLEVHTDPKNAMSDSETQLDFVAAKKLLGELAAMY